MVLLGNKADLKRAVSKKQAEEYAKLLSRTVKQYGFTMQYLDTSAKTGLNVKEAFELLGRQIIQAIQSGKLNLA